MNIEVRKKANGDIYYSPVYWNGKRKVRLKISEHPPFNSLEEANEWANAKTAEFDSMKARALRRQEWKSKYYNFSKLTSEYMKHCKKVQKNSWKNTEFYLYNYVLPYFLSEKHSNNPNNWNMYFQDFKNWLEDVATTITEPKRIISYSSKNHCIKILNTFLNYLLITNKVDPVNVYKISGFSTDKLNSRDADDLIKPKEFEDVYNHLLRKNEKVAILFQTAYYTGMRFSEIYGLSMNNLYQGQVDDEMLRGALEQHNIDYYGYIVLESQPAEKTRKRLPDGTIKRKPLKSRKKICEKNNRVVPIIDKELFNNLVKLYKEQQKLHQKSVFGSDRDNYMLFDEISTSICNRELHRGFKTTGYKYKSFHCCRHTRCTELVGRTRDFVLARIWLGHTRQEVTLRYTHIFQQTAREAKRKKQKIDFI